MEVNNVSDQILKRLECTQECIEKAKLKSQF